MMLSPCHCRSWWVLGDIGLEKKKKKKKKKVQGFREEDGVSVGW